MTSQLDYEIVSKPEDAESLGILLNQCFNSSSGWETYSNRIGLENFRIIRQAGKIIGGLSILPMGQWYGSELVPMAGIASVGIARQYRGTGAAIQLLSLTPQRTPCQWSATFCTLCSYAATVSESGDVTAARTNRRNP